MGCFRCELMLQWLFWTIKITTNKANDFSQNESSEKNNSTCSQQQAAAAICYKKHDMKILSSLILASLFFRRFEQTVNFSTTVTVRSFRWIKPPFRWNAKGKVADCHKRMKLFFTLFSLSCEKMVPKCRWKARDDRFFFFFFWQRPEVCPYVRHETLCPPNFALKPLFSTALGDTAYSQEHLKTIVYHCKILGQTKCLMGNSKPSLLTVPIR